MLIKILLVLNRPRPHLIPRLNETLPNKCSSCARRFEDSEKGRKEKRAHLDWHFRVHQRMAESVKRGQNRSWYVDEEVRISGSPCFYAYIEFGGCGRFGAGRCGNIYTNRRVPCTHTHLRLLPTPSSLPLYIHLPFPLGFSP